MTDKYGLQDEFLKLYLYENAVIEDYLIKALVTFIKWLQVFHNGNYIYEKSRNEIMDEFINFIKTHEDSNVLDDYDFDETKIVKRFKIVPVEE